MRPLIPLIVLRTGFAIIALALLASAHIALAQEDLTPPALLDVQFEPRVVDTSKGPATITVTVHVTDDLSGVKHTALFFHKPGTTQRAQVEFRPGEMPHRYFGYWLAGDTLSGWYTNTMTLPQYAAYGEWEMNLVVLEDNVGNIVHLYRPDPGDEQAMRGSQWPAIYNGFTFAVGIADNDAPPPAQRAAYLPLLR